MIESNHGQISSYLFVAWHRGFPNGTVSKIQHVLEPHLPGVSFVRPLLPHHDPESPPEESVEFLKELKIPKNTLIIGVSMGGLVAAKLQEESRPDLHVVCISSPTQAKAGSFRLKKKIPNRISFYSSSDEVIAQRVKDWPKLAQAYDFPWLNHDTDVHLDRLAKLILGYINGDNLSSVI